MYRLIFILLSFFVGTTTAGSPCPSREDIYPCTCLSFPLAKKVLRTIVNCHHIRDSDSLKIAFSALKNVQIDQLHIFNSFWEIHKLGGNANQMLLPMNWLTQLKVKEIEIFDTALATCFACQSSIECRNSLTVSFKVVNASASDNLCGLCESSRGPYSWTDCMKKLQHFEYTHGKLGILDADLFPRNMPSLKTLNLSHNQILDIKPNSFQNLKRLAVLDLSHNYLEDVDFIQTSQMSLEFLDVSWNHIKQLADNLLSFLPYLKTIGLGHNEITEFKESEWKNPPSSLKTIDLTENPLHCDCSIRWVNATFHINTVIEGTCASPEDYETSLIRKASRMLIERCDEDGNIGSRTTKKKSNAPVTAAPRFRSQYRIRPSIRTTSQ